MSDRYPATRRWYTTPVNLGVIEVGHRFPIGGLLEDTVGGHWVVRGVHYVVGSGRKYELEPVNEIAQAAFTLAQPPRRYGACVSEDATNIERHCRLVDE